MKKQLLLFFSTLCLCSTYAQNTVGLLSYDAAQAYAGYNLIFPHNQPNVYLLDNCGEIVHTWTDEANFRPGNIAYLTEEGNLIKGKRDAVVVDDPIWAGGGGETLEILDWDNNLLHSMTINDSLQRMHHDFAPMPNGNILLIVWEKKTRAEAIEAGRDPAKMERDELWPDKIIEWNPELDSIVWEWHAWDHLIQDFDSTKANYGVVADHPEKIDINWDTEDGDPDWMHSNAIDYNPRLDQIILCVPTFHEFWVIDHTTSREQAATDRGGLGERGGDLMYRWGNPATYRAGTAEDQQLFYPHDIHWVDDFLDFTFPDYDKIAIFNNRVGADFSTANLLRPAWDMYGWKYTLENGQYNPRTFDRTYYHPDTTALWSTGLSSVQLLPNGNTLICAGRFGYAFELSPANEIVWEYITPLRGGQPVAQGDTTLAINNNLTFRLKRYPEDFAAFDGKDLSSKGWIETSPDTNFCNQLTTDVMDVLRPAMFRIYPNPSSNDLTIEWDGIYHADIRIYNQTGQLMASFPNASGGRKYLSTANWQQGLYFVGINNRVYKKVIIQR